MLVEIKFMLWPQLIFSSNFSLGFLLSMRNVALIYYLMYYIEDNFFSIVAMFTTLYLLFRNDKKSYLL